MAKKKQPPTRPRKKIILIISAVAVLVLICFFGIRAFVHHQQTEATYQRDKVRFATTEKDMDSAYAAIVKTVGKPYETKKTKGCGYGALKYARGPLSCGISYAFSYETNSRADSKQIGQKMLKVVNRNYGFSNGEPNYGISELARESGQYIEYLKNSDGMSCELNFDTYDKEMFNSMYDLDGLVRDARSNVVSVVSIGCNDYTPKPFYKLDKSTE